MTRGEPAPGAPWEAPAIRVEAEARAMLERHGAAVTLRGSRRHGCCGGTAFVPVAEPGAPVERAGFHTVDVEGITVWVEDGIAPGAVPIVVGVDRVWRWSRLRVDGTAIRM